MKITIISSFNEPCGPAFYSARLAHHLTEISGCNVSVARLDVGLLRVLGNKKILKKAEAHLNEVIEKARASDAVLLQLEPGLYSSYPSLAYKRILKILNGIDKPIIITVHGFERVTNYSSGLLSVAYGLFRGLGLKNSISRLYETLAIPKINNFWLKISQKSNIHVVTFCDADANLLRRFHDIVRVSTIPISYYSKEEVERIKTKLTKETFYKKFGLNQDKKFISLVGFLGKYKGHKTALAALGELPPEYELLIAGGVHPQGIDVDVEVGSYTKELFQFINSQRPLNNRVAFKSESHSAEFPYQGKFDLSSRVHFLGPLTDEEVNLVFCGSDFVVLPYLRTRSGQSASGPAVLAMEFLTNSFYSHSPVFLQYEKHFPLAMRFFDIGNSLELAQKIKNDMNVRGDYLENAKKSLEAINPKSMVDSYIKVIQELSQNYDQ